MDFFSGDEAEKLYEEAYRAELEAWRTKGPDAAVFTAPKNAYDSAYIKDVCTVWIPGVGIPLYALAAALDFLPNLGFMVVAGFTIPGLIFADIRSKSQLRAGRLTGIGPFGWTAYRHHLAAVRGPQPARLDPWSSEAIAKSLAFARKRLQEEQSAVIERIWSAKLDVGNAIEAGQDMLERIQATGSDSLLRSARVEALHRMIERNRVISAELDAQEKLALERPLATLERLKGLEAELLQRDAIAVLLNEEERTRLREAETAAIRESVTGLLGMVRQCEVSLEGIRTEIGLQEAAERELRQTLG